MEWLSFSCGLVLDILFTIRIIMNFRNVPPKCLFFCDTPDMLSFGNLTNLSIFWKADGNRERTTACPLRVVWCDESSRRGSPSCSWTGKPRHTTDTGTYRYKDCFPPEWRKDKNPHGEVKSCNAGSQCSGLGCPCDSCESRATQRGIQMIHNRVHHGGTTFACDQCDYMAGNWNALKNHMKVYHNGRQCLCSCCDYKCTLGVHRGGTTFFCNQCDYMARKRNALKIHMKIKHDGRQCQCNHCELNPREEV